MRPVGREEAEANTAKTAFDLAAHDSSHVIPRAKVVISTTGLVWEQKGQSHSPLNAHMEDVDILINEGAQQDMDLKTAFTPAVPRQPFFRAILGDPKQSPGGVADDQREHRTLLLKAPIGLRADHKWHMPHELLAVLGALMQSCQGFPQEEVLHETEEARNNQLGQQWFRPEALAAKSSLGCSLQKAYKDLSRVDLALPEGVLVGLGYAVTTPDSSFRFHQAHEPVGPSIGH